MTRKGHAPSNLHGILVIDKPGLEQSAASEMRSEARLPTSHDVVQWVRRWSGQRRIGHTGTLDPMASGVLVLCLGLATRLVEYYQGHSKCYTAEVVLGTSTDTYDATGSVVAEAPVPTISPASLDEALAQFQGEVLQRPPVYSALKQEGEAAYRRARRGEAVEMTPRPVTFYTLEVTDFIAPNRIMLDIHCSAGTYIRSLAHDLGQALGVPAHLARLRRTAAGQITLTQAHLPAAVEAAAAQGALAPLLLPLGAGLELPTCAIDAEQATRFGHGQLVEMDAGLPSSVMLARATDKAGKLLGMIRRVAPNQDTEASQSAGLSRWKTEKWLVVDPV